MEESWVLPINVCLGTLDFARICRSCEYGSRVKCSMGTTNKTMSGRKKNEATKWLEKKQQVFGEKEDERPGHAFLI